MFEIGLIQASPVGVEPLLLLPPRQGMLALVLLPLPVVPASGLARNRQQRLGLRPQAAPPQLQRHSLSVRHLRVLPLREEQTLTSDCSGDAHGEQERSE